MVCWLFVWSQKASVHPFFADPIRVDGIGGEDEDDEVGIEALADFIDDVLAGEDFAFVEPDGHGGILAEEGGEFADEWFVFAGVAEEDGDHVSAGAFVMVAGYERGMAVERRVGPWGGTLTSCAALREVLEWLEGVG